MTHVIRDAIRRLWREPGFTCAAVLALGLGIGGANTVFTIINGIFLRGLPAPHASQIVAIRNSDAGDQGRRVSYSEYQDWRQGSRSFVDVGAFAIANMVVSDEGRSPERFLGAFVTASTFEAVGGFSPRDRRGWYGGKRRIRERSGAP